MLVHWSLAIDVLRVLPEPVAAFARAGYLGVDVFFLLSGAVIIHSSMGRTWSQFAQARFLRLFPVFVASAVLLLIWRKVELGAEWTAVDLIDLSGLNFWLGTGYIVGPSWTLQFEVTFYALVVVAIIAARDGLTEHRVRMGIAIYLAAFVVATYSSNDVLGIITINGFGPLFMLGALLGISRTGEALRSNSVLILIALTLSAFTEMSRTAEMGATGFAQVLWIAAVLLIPGGVILWASLRPGDPDRFTRLRPAVATVSLMTYPIYLLHHEFGTTLLIAVQTAAGSVTIGVVSAFVVVVGLSWLSVRFYEPWARRGLRRFFGWRVTPRSTTSDESPRPAPEPSSP